MNSLPRNAECPTKKRPLNRQLLLSHLSVALVGISMLLAALVSTYELRNRVVLLAHEGAPMVQASLRVLAGVQYSLASLRGWVSLGDSHFLEDWRTAWEQDILPAIAMIKQCRRMFEQTCTLERLPELQTLLTELQESQEWVKDMAHTPNNEPARLIYQVEITSNVTKMKMLLTALQHEEDAQDDAPGRKALLVRIMKIQSAVFNTQLLLREILGINGLQYAEALPARLDAVQSQIAEMTEHPLLTPHERQTLTLFQQDWRSFTTLAIKMTERRQAADWNLALHRMAVETDPLADRVTTLVAAMAADSETRLEQEVHAARLTSVVTISILVMTALTMLAVAYRMSRKRARSLARPIAALAEATRRLEEGFPTEDLPVRRNDELGELTRTFNHMRASMQQTQMELREANALLEKRVLERTTQLALTNASLTQEIEFRNQTEKALRESEARVRAMTRAIPDLVFVVDAEGRYREVLAAGREWDAHRITPARGRFPSETSFRRLQKRQETSNSQSDHLASGIIPVRGKLLSEVHSPEMAEFFIGIIHRALETRQIQVAEYELSTTSGLRWFESRTAPLDIPLVDQQTAIVSNDQMSLFGSSQSSSAEKLAVIVVARDITKRKQSENQLRQAQKMQAIGQLTGGIAHDFNNLLAVIMGNLELLHEQLMVHPRLYELALQALRAVDRGAALTRRLLVFARRQPLQAQSTDLNKLVLGMIELIRRTLGATIQIETALAPDLEQTYIDPDQFESALLNLVINARDAMPQAGRLVLETANAVLDEDYAATHQDVRPGAYVVLAVSDSGTGMAPEVLERAFEPFFTTKETSKGSGLGLSMVYGLVKQSGGHVTIYSELGRGTTVRLYLPRIHAEAPAVFEPADADVSFEGHGETILVVEDDVDVRLFAIRALHSLGYETCQADNAKTALEILNLNPRIALLFTDIVLPGDMDGVHLATEATRRRPELPVLFTSGYTERMLVSGGGLAEGVEILAKPYRKAELGGKLRTLLNRRAKS
ncbi:MAG TPA: ATP-binding protein [Candidatus Competibacteraceae bacterium]|nr:ATP-binding protein [Candidatus Competibacteraceae bacterium]